MILKTLFGVFGLLLWVAVADAQLIRKDQIDPAAFPNLSEMCAAGCQISTADSPSTALEVGDSLDFIRFYRSAAGKLVMRCVIGGVEGACDEGFEIKAGFYFQLCDEFGVCGVRWKPEEPNAFDLSCGSAPATPASNRLKTFCENDLLKVKNDAGTVTTLGAGGGSSVLTLARFRPSQNEPPTSNACAFDTRNSHPVLKCDATTDESSVFSETMPLWYSGGDMNVIVRFAATSATSGAMGWCAAFERMNAGGQDLDSDGFATAKCVSVTVSGTSGVTALATITFSNAEADSIAVGEGYRLKVTRDADGSVVTDSATGDGEIVLVHVTQ